jgi:hypothetical protein
VAHITSITERQKKSGERKKEKKEERKKERKKKERKREKKKSVSGKQGSIWLDKEEISQQ